MRTKSPKRKREVVATNVAASAAEPAKPTPVLALASNCSVKDAAALKESLCRHLDEEAAVTLDVRSVQRVDTATMQLLCAFVRDRAARQLKVEWLGESAALCEAARLLGVEQLLAPASQQSQSGARA